MDNIKAMAEFTEVMKYKPAKAEKFISDNYQRFNKDDLVVIIKQLLYAMKTDCMCDMGFILEDAAIALDEQYDEMYQKIR